MITRVEISLLPDTFDARGAGVLDAAPTLGVRGLRGAAVSDLFFLAGPELTPDDVERVVRRLLVDPVVSEARVGEGQPGPGVVEVAPLPGTTDAAAESLLEAAHALGVTRLTAAASGRRYQLDGDATDADLRRLATGLLANEVVEQVTVGVCVHPHLTAAAPADDTVERPPLLSLDDGGLLALSRARRLSLDLAEMRAVQAWFRGEGREPTDAELEMVAQTWSEHCVHKTFKAIIELDEDGVTSTVDSMFRTWIAGATDAAASPWLRSVFVDNAGVVGFVDGWDLAFKVETHNHPSALEPFGGANTGVGGVIRDVLGVSARPIACTDVLCFGPADLPFDQLPAGVLHPRRIAAGVVAGVGDYGNKMGLPTVNGAVLYDRGYVSNPLVYCGCLGLVRAGAHRREARPGDRVVVVGGRTGRDGLRGATFSSMEMDTGTASIASSSVQIGHPIHEKQVMEAVLQARDEGLYTAITDCGAGGLSSAVGEMAEGLGAEVQLDHVPLKYPGLRPWEVWLSEAQERMVLAVPPERRDRFHAVCAAWGVEATDLGAFTDTGRLRLRHGATTVADLALDLLHHGIPRRALRGVWRTPPARDVELPPLDLEGWLLDLLASPDIRSKEDVVRTYDHEVLGGTIVKPFAGPAQAGPSDAAVLRPLDVVLETGRHDGPGVALSNGICPRYGRLDPYAMAWAAVDEAVRNAVCAGADPDRVALLDNFCWGNPNLPDRLGALARCARGCHDAAVAFGAPYISGKDSLNNEYADADGQRHAIPGTLLISALALVPDVAATLTSALTTPGAALVLVGDTADELGGSALCDLLGDPGGRPPAPVPDGLARARAVHAAITRGLARAAHDPSEGGLLVAIAEMAIGGGLGARVDLDAAPWRGDGRDALRAAFAESSSRYVLEVTPGQLDALAGALDGVPWAVIGEVTAERTLRVGGAAIAVDALAAAFGAAR